MNLTLTQLLELVDQIRRSWWVLIAAVCFGLAAAVIAMAYLPKQYQAHATIMVVPRQVPEELVPDTVTDDMSFRLGAVRAALLSRPYMAQLISEVYGDVEDEDRMEGLSRWVESRLEVDVIRIDPRRGGGMFGLSFLDPDPERAAKVVNTLTRLYIEQNVQFRTEQAKGTSETMWTLVQEAEEQLQVKERELAEFRRRHLYDSSQHRDTNLQQLMVSRSELERINRAIGQIEDRVQTLEVQQEQAEQISAAIPEVVGLTDPIQAELARRQRELSELRADYHDDHPAVQRAVKQLEEFIEQNASQLQVVPEGSGEENGSGGVILSPYQIQIASAKKEIKRLEAEAASGRSEIAVYNKRLDDTPKVEQELAELTKDYEVLESTYNQRLAGYEDTKAALRIEEAQQGERFEIVEKARSPKVPVKPLPMIVFGFSVAAAFAVFVGPLVLFGLISPKIRSESGLQKISDYPILVNITRLPTDGAAKSRKRVRIVNLLGSSVSVMVLVAVVYLFKFGIGAQ